MTNMMKLHLLTFVTATCCLLSSSCTNLSDRKIETPLLITIIDLHEAENVRECLQRSGAPKGSVRVDPGSKTTTAHIKTPLDPANENKVRESMRAIKAELTRHRGRTANTLIFIFPNAKLVE